MYPIAVKVDNVEAEFKGHKEYVEDLSTSDPFNKSDVDNPSYAILNFGIICNPAPEDYFRLLYIYRPTITEVFDDGKVHGKLSNRNIKYSFKKNVCKYRKCKL